MRIRKDVRVPTIQLVQVEAEEEEEEEVSQVTSIKERAAKPDFKGKSIVSSPEKAKKTQMPQIDNSQEERGSSFLMLLSSRERERYTSNSYAYLRK